MSIIYFFNFLTSILYYLGTMTWVVSKVGWVLQVTLGTTACESTNAAANIFLGQTEAPGRLGSALKLQKLGGKQLRGHRVRKP